MFGTKIKRVVTVLLICLMPVFVLLMSPCNAKADDTLTKETGVNVALDRITFQLGINDESVPGCVQYQINNPSQKKRVVEVKSDDGIIKKEVEPNKILSFQVCEDPGPLTFIIGPIEVPIPLPICKLQSFADKCNLAIGPNRLNIIEVTQVANASIPICIDNSQGSGQVRIEAGSGGNVFPITVGPFARSCNTLSNVGNDIRIRSFRENLRTVGVCVGRCA